MRHALIATLILFFVLPFPCMCSTGGGDIERVCFSPGGDCANHIITAIDQAKTEIKIQAYTFTSANIARALLAAQARGVAIEVIFDKSQLTNKYSPVTFFKNNNIPVYIDDAHAIMHDKIIIIDKQIVITGSYNFSRAAEERNSENVIFVRSESIASQYLANWQAHKEHSTIQ